MKGDDGRASQRCVPNGTLLVIVVRPKKERELISTRARQLPLPWTSSRSTSTLFNLEHPTLAPDHPPSLSLPLASSAIRFNSGGAHAHETESYESFNQRYQTFFTNVEDVFELQRGLNNCFAYDLVPSTGVIESALKAARKVDDYATAVRILEGVKEKVENKGQYQAYLDELKPIITELGECQGVPTPEGAASMVG